jgi:PAS domain S-box-containing protein
MPGRWPVGEGEERYRLLFERATDGMWLADREGWFVDMNPAACAMLGYSREEHLRLSVGDVIREEEAPRLRDLMCELAAGHQITDIWEVRRADGTYVSLELSHAFTPDGLWQAIGRDITERGRAEAALRDSEERYRLAVEAADLGRWELVPKTGEFYTSATCNRHLGLPKDARPTHGGHFETIHPEDHAMIYARLRRTFEEGGEFEVEYRVIHPDGGIRRILSRARLLRSPGSAPDRLMGITLDVTEARELSMRERAEMLDGTLRVDSERGKGTRVEVRVPLDGQRS